MTRFAAKLITLTITMALCGAQAQSPDFAKPKSMFSEKEVEAFSNVQMELTACIAYFNFLIRCSPKEMEAETARQLDPTLKFMNKTAFEIGKTIVMTDDAMTSRVKMALEDQMNVMQKSCTNFSSLYVRHGKRCKQGGENLDSIYDEYLKK